MSTNREIATNYWKENKFSESCKYFTLAINEQLDASGGPDKETLKVLYSNRSACNLKINKVEDAINDAKKSVEIDSKFEKGYLRLGDAYHMKKSYKEALTAYEACLKLNSSNTSVISKINEVKSIIRRQSGSTLPASSLGEKHKYLHYAVLVMIAVYILPLGFSGIAFRLAGLFHLISCYYYLSELYGPIRFSKEYLFSILQNLEYNKQVLLSFLLMILPVPSFACLLPILFYTAVVFSGQLIAYMKSHKEEIEARAAPLLAKINPQLAGQFSLETLLNPVYKNQIYDALIRTVGLMELSNGVMLLVQLFLPTRSIFQVVLFWQYLRMRYVLEEQAVKAKGGSRDFRNSCKDFDQNFQSILNHRFAPKFLRPIYEKIKTFLASQVEIKPPAANGAAKKGCNIM